MTKNGDDSATTDRRGPRREKLGERPLALVVDDDQRTSRMLAEGLHCEGFVVLAASDGSQALRLLERSRPDIILLDLMMPGTNGLEVLRAIRRRSDCVTIMVSAVDGSDFISRSIIAT